MDEKIRRRMESHSRPAKLSVLRPVGFEPTRFGETVGLKSTPLDHSGRSAFLQREECTIYTHKLITWNK